MHQTFKSSNVFNFLGELKDPSSNSFLQILFIILGLLALLIGYGLYVTFGEGSKELVDQIDEHAKMHELGIAHGHEGKRAIMTSAEKDYPKHKHED